MLMRYNVNIGKVNHLHYFHQSFTHKSYVKKEVFTDEILSASRKEMGNPDNLLELQKDSYERLEYFGDRVVKIVVSFYLFNRYPSEDEGFMTRLQTKIEDKKNLAYLSKEIGLGKYFLISNYLFTFKQLFFNKIIYVSIKFSKKTFFLATFLLYCFCNLKFKFLIKKKEFNILLPTIYFIYFFNIFLSYSLNINFFKTDFKNLIFLNFKIKNILSIPSSYLFIFNKYK
jgi:hypothetical protein